MVLALKESDKFRENLLRNKPIAHMGASLEAPQNTLSAFRKARELNVDLIEFDVHVSQDGIPVVTHDASLGWDKLPLECHSIKELTPEEIKRFDVGGWFSKEFVGETIPTLKEVLALGGHFMVEIKWAGEPFQTYVDPILSQLEGTDSVIGCMNPSIVDYVKNQGFKTVGIVQSSPNLETFITLRPEILALRSQLINKELIQRLHDLGIEAWGWTIDNIERGKRFEEMGLDGVITNNSREFKACF